MENIKCYLLWIVLFAGIFYACDKKEDTPATLSITPASLSFESRQSDLTMSIKSSGTWTISGNPGWLTLSAASGSGDMVVTITAGENTDEKERSVQLSVEAAGNPAKTVNVPVTQKGKSSTGGETKTVTLEKAGNLKSALSEQDWKTVSALVIKGEMNSQDFAAIKELASHLISLDISGTNLHKIPDYALSNQKGSTSGTAGMYRNAGRTAASGELEQPEPQGWEVAMPDLEVAVIPEGTDTIGLCAFAGCGKLVKVEFPEGLRVISGDAFSGCKMLPPVSFPSTLEKIDFRAFYECEQMISLVIPASVIYIGDNCFSMSGLTSVEIPGTVTELGGGILAACPELTSFTLSGERKSVPGYIVAECPKLTQITLPQSVRRIENSAFSGCIALTSLDFLPQGVTEIGFGAFRECTGLTRLENLPETLEKIESGAFGSCRSLEKITIPERVKVLDILVFENCIKLSEVGLPAGLDSIKQSAFEGCTALTALELPDNITSFDHWAFRNCTNLKKVKLPAALAYEVTANHMVMPVFAGCDQLSEIIFPAGLTQLPGYLFSGCKGLTTLEIPEHISKIGAGTFHSCSNLVSVTLPENLTSLGSCFGDCISLKNIEIPSGITSLPGRLFSGCTALENVVIKGEISQISYYMFQGCTALRQFDVPEGVVSLEEGAFSGCTSLTRITFPSTLERISEGVFTQWQEIKEIICYAAKPPVIENQRYSFTSILLSRCVIKVPGTSVNAYKAASVWSEAKDQIVSIEGGDPVKRRLKQMTSYPSSTPSGRPDSEMKFIYYGDDLSEVELCMDVENGNGEEVPMEGKIYIGVNTEGERRISIPMKFIDGNIEGDNQNGVGNVYYTLNAQGLAVSSREEYVNVTKSYPEVTHRYFYNTEFTHMIKSIRYVDGKEDYICQAEWNDNGNLSKIIVTDKSITPGMPGAVEVYDKFTYTTQVNTSGFISPSCMPELYMNDVADYFMFMTGILGKGSMNYSKCGSLGDDPYFKIEYTFDSNGDPSMMVITDGVGPMQESSCSVMVFE